MCISVMPGEFFTSGGHATSPKLRTSRDFFTRATHNAFKNAKTVSGRGRKGSASGAPAPCSDSSARARDLESLPRGLVDLRFKLPKRKATYQNSHTMRMHGPQELLRFATRCSLLDL